MPELRATTDGTPITALDEGRGPNLLVVHPGGGNQTSWDGVARILADGFRVIRIRRRIYVPTAPLSPTHSMAVEAADILAIAALLEPPILLVGHSSGAVAALEAALRAPATFTAMLLYEPPLPTRTLVAGDAGQRARAALIAGNPLEAMKIHLRDVVQMPAQLVNAMCDAPEARPIFAAAAPAQLADNDAIDALGLGIDRYRALDIPTTLVEGELSPPHLRQRLADLAATLPNACVVTLPNQGHIANFTAPTALATTIRDMAARALNR
jgi:pimeloyl-ACP methyl ester carboxylesterase